MMPKRYRLPLVLLTLGLVPPVSGAVDLQYEQISDQGGVVDIRHAGDGSGRLFLVEQPGRVRVLVDGAEADLPFLDITARVRSGGERGLLSLAFAPDYAESGLFYTWYTNRDSDTVLSRFSVSDDPDRADPDSEQILLTVPQPQTNHNGGQLQFGPDGYLYLGIGDGGGAGDPLDQGQDPGTLLGSLIRIDVDPAHGGYAIPEGNPLVGQSGRDETWAWGLRNPWRIAFDTLTGDLYIADVGQGSFEEINVQGALDGGGQNYGWNRMEGSNCYQDDCDPTGLVLPVGGYSHAHGCSVTGGVVYRGQAYPDLHGTYLFGDYCSGRVWGLSRSGQGWNQAILDDSGFSILTWGTGEDGSVYLSASGVGVFRVSDGTQTEEPPFTINPGLNDAWYFASTDGQGFFINVFPNRQELFLAWFTFDTERPDEDVSAVLGEPGHRWLTAIGNYRGGRADLEVSLTRGGVFDQAVPQPETTPAGTISLAFSGCNSAMVTYVLPSLGLSGQVPIRRVTEDNVALCEALSLP